MDLTPIELFVKLQALRQDLKERRSIAAWRTYGKAKRDYYRSITITPAIEETLKEAGLDR